MMMEKEPLFDSVEAALRFAFCYGGQQSPRTPMSAALQGGAIGTGKGLYGTDGAAQAGMIRAKLEKHLPQEQRWLLAVRYGEPHRQTCTCCGHEHRSPEWTAAADSLAHFCGLEGIAKPLKREMLAKILCRSKADLSGSTLPDRTLRYRMATLKNKLGGLEHQAMCSARECLREMVVYS